MKERVANDSWSAGYRDGKEDRRVNSTRVEDKLAYEKGWVKGNTNLKNEAHNLICLTMESIDRAEEALELGLRQAELALQNLKKS